MKRRQFVSKSIVGSLLVGTGKLSASALESEEVVKLTILHTNDVHSRIDPFPDDGSRNGGKGGAARRARLIKDIRTVESNVMLLDAGDIFQGTPYFNVFKGELEFKLMTAMGYDAATIGNHDFDAGIDGLLAQLPNANFPLINCNYDVSNTALKDNVLPYKIFQKGPLKIGVLGVGIALEGLVPAELYGDTIYTDPISAANQTAAQLKEQGCAFIICLSHLGFKYKGDKVDDISLARQTEDIDLIIGGHTHTFLDEPVIQGNKKGDAVIINQVGWAGIMLGRVDVYFEFGKANKCASLQKYLDRLKSLEYLL